MGPAAFFSRVPGVGRGKPLLGSSPADPQALERLPDILEADVVGRQAALPADFGGQPQGPGAAGLAKGTRAVVHQRPQWFAPGGIEDKTGVLGAAGVALEAGQPPGMEGADGIAHALGRTPQGTLHKISHEGALA